MAKVFLICGKIASGKTYFANQLLQEKNTVLLSSDELMLTLFPEDLGPDYDTYMFRALDYLHTLSEQFIKSDINVVLDWGFWSKAERERATNYYRSRNIPYEWHYIDVTDESWKKHIQERNNDVEAGKSDAYLVEEWLLDKMFKRFEVPEKDEIDFWHSI